MKALKAQADKKCKLEEQGRQTSNDKAKARKHHEQPQRQCYEKQCNASTSRKHTQEKLLLGNGQREVHIDVVESTADV